MLDFVTAIFARSYSRHERMHMKLYPLENGPSVSI